MPHRCDPIKDASAEPHDSTIVTSRATARILDVRDLGAVEEPPVLDYPNQFELRSTPS